MPAAAFILPALEIVAPSVFAAITAPIAGAVGAGLGAAGATTLASATGLSILGATTVADIATGALLGAGTAAAQAAIQGGDVGKAALAGAVSGGVAPAVSGTLGKALGVAEPLAGTTGPTLPTGTQAATQRGLTGLAAGTAGGVAAGQPIETAVKGAIPGAVGGALSGAAQYGLGIDSSTSKLLGQAGSQLTRYATTPTPSISYPTYQSSQAGPPSLTGGRQAAAPSATLGQSLSIAPTLGYSPGGTVFGSGGEGDTPKSRVWNVASLRNIGEEA